LYKKENMNISHLVNRSILVGKKYSPDILVVGGIAMGIAAGVTAATQTRKIEPILMEHEIAVQDLEAARLAAIEKPSPEEIRAATIGIYFETTKRLGKLYALPIALGVASISSVAGGYLTLRNREAQAVTAFALLSASYAKYRERVKEHYGDDADTYYKNGIVDNMYVTDPETGAVTKAGEPTGKYHPVDTFRSIYAQEYDARSIYWSHEDVNANIHFLVGRQNYWNDVLATRGHVFLNEVYTSLGLPHTQAGAICGWVYNLADGSDGYIDFGMKNLENLSGSIAPNAILVDPNVSGIIYDLI
jgi:hypothetical protein